MFKKMTKTKVSQIAAAFALALAPVPATSLGVSEVCGSSGISTTFSVNPGEVVFLPIDQATDYMLEQSGRLKVYIRMLKDEWESNPAPVEMAKQSSLVQKHLLNELNKRADLARGFLAAARLAVSNDKIKEDEKIFSQIKKFARSASGLLYTIEELLSFIEQTHPLKATSSALEELNPAEVKSMIRAEHKSLGLGAPAFDC